MLDDPRPWPNFGSETGDDLLLFRPRWDLLENPRTGRRMKRLVLETRDWVNVVAVTQAGEFVMVKQYRFGSAQVTTEIPGGVIDDGESPREAGERELREETGYVSERWTALGSVQPNPAFLDNRCHHFLAEGATLVQEQELDGGEDIAVFEMSAEEVRRTIAAGEIDHALVLTALQRVLDLRLPGHDSD